MIAATEQKARLQILGAVQQSMGASLVNGEVSRLEIGADVKTPDGKQNRSITIMTFPTDYLRFDEPSRSYTITLPENLKAQPVQNVWPQGGEEIR